MGRLYRRRDGAGSIREVVGLSLRLRADTVDLYVTATAKISAPSLVIKTTNGNVIQNPFLSVRNTAFEQIFKLAAKFGLARSEADDRHVVSEADGTAVEELGVDGGELPLRS